MITNKILEKILARDAWNQISAENCLNFGPIFQFFKKSFPLIFNGKICMKFRWKNSAEKLFRKIITLCSLYFCQIKTFATQHSAIQENPVFYGSVSKTKIKQKIK